MIKKKVAIKVTCTVAAVFIVAILVASIVLWSGVLTKKLSTDNAFTILQITDVHLRNDNRDKMVLDTVDKMIKKAKPDLIAVTGDVSSNKENERDFRKFAEFIEKYKIEWTFTFGNHDAEGTWTKAEISNFLASLEYCSYEEGLVVPKQGMQSHDSMGNYSRNVKDSAGNDIMSLFFMDSNMYLDDEETGFHCYANFVPEQVDWYKNEVKKIAREVNGNEDKVLPSLAFLHIPMQEFDTAYYSSNNKNLLNGAKHEKVFCSELNDEMFETMVELNSTKGVFVGHDHMNSYTMDYRGIKLSYAYSADHTLYFVPQRGGNVINIKKDGTFTMQGLYRNFGVGALIATEEF